MSGVSTPQMTFFYQGQVAASGSVYIYQTGTTTPLTIYSDAGLTTPITNPINLNANGQCIFYTSGAVNVRMDAYTGLAGAGVLIESIDPAFPVGAPSILIPWVVATGTADAITATYSPVISTLTDGLLLSFRAISANATTTPTFAPNSLTAHTITQSGGAALVAGNIAAQYAEYFVRYNLANTRWELMNPTYVPSVLPAIFPQGRLSLVSGVSVQTTDVSGATTIYYVPYEGQIVPVYNGSAFINLSIGSQISLALDSSSGHTGYQASGSVFDLFVYSASGTATLATGPAWTNATTRSNAISLQNGIWTNTSTITLRFGTVSGNTASIGANQATYVGTMYASANGQCTMLLKPSAAAGGGAPIIGLYNAYNRVRTFAVCRDSTSTWSYGTATWRSTNNSTSNRIIFVDGLGQSNITTKISGTASGSGVNLDQGIVGVVLNATSGAPVVGATTLGVSGASAPTAVACDEFYPYLGQGYAQGMEYGGGSTLTWYGLMDSQQVQSFSLNIDV